jgi:hypothetical protein
MGIPTSPVWQGVGIIGAWFAAGMWIYSRTRFLGARQPPYASHRASRVGCGRRGHHEHRRARLARHLSRYSHVRMEAKRRALDEIAVRQRDADENRQKEAERRQATLASQSVVVQ